MNIENFIKELISNNFIYKTKFHQTSYCWSKNCDFVDPVNFAFEVEKNELFLFLKPHVQFFTRNNSHNNLYEFLRLTTNQIIYVFYDVEVYDLFAKAFK